MTAHRVFTAVLLAALCVVANAQAPSRPELLRMIGQTLSATVISVADGDTVRARLDGSSRPIRIRLEVSTRPSAASRSARRRATRRA